MVTVTSLPLRSCRRTSITGIEGLRATTWYQMPFVVDHNLPFGSERLLTLRPLRLSKSWVRLTGQLPSEAQTLDVVVAYSGDRSSAGAHAYRYWFEMR